MEINMKRINVKLVNELPIRKKFTVANAKQQKSCLACKQVKIQTFLCG